MSGRATFIAAHFLFFLIAGSAAIAAEPSPLLASPPTSLQAMFTPQDDIEIAVAEIIQAARKKILVQAYLLTSKKIAAALVEAYRHGVDVRVLLDAEQLDKASSSAAAELSAAGIAVWLETKYQHAHNKIIVIDPGTEAATVITGSFNFTWAAQHKNAENILIVRNNPGLAARFATNWEQHQQEASPYKK